MIISQRKIHRCNTQLSPLHPVSCNQRLFNVLTYDSNHNSPHRGYGILDYYFLTTSPALLLTHFLLRSILGLWSENAGRGGPSRSILQNQDCLPLRIDTLSHAHQRNLRSRESVFDMKQI